MCARCSELESELRPYRLRERLRLTPAQAAIVNALYEAYPASVNEAALMGTHAHEKPIREIDPNIMRAHIAHIRRTVLGWRGERGIELTGYLTYALTAQGRRDVDRALVGPANDIAA